MIADPLAFDHIRARPDAAFIQNMRERFDVEREIDVVLSRKLARRAGPPYSPIALERLISGTAALLEDKLQRPFKLENPRWLQGGSSKLQMAFDLSWHNPVTGRAETTAMVLRMEPPESIVETSRRREFEILDAVSGVVPVPKVYWMDPDGDYLPYPALIYGFAEGITKPKERPGQAVRGVGTNFSPDLRRAISDQFVAHLAAVHSARDIDLDKLVYFDAASAGTNASVIKQINWWRRVWEEDRPEEVPLVDVVTRWLIDNAPPLDHVSIVHGDYRAGNFLFTEHDRKITAVLDWELCVLGDRHQDLTWSTGKAQSRYAEDGKTLLASGLIQHQEFFDRYEAASGLSVDPKRLRYFRIFNELAAVTHMLATAWRVGRYSKTHQDIVVSWHSIVGNVIIGKLRESLEELL